MTNGLHLIIKQENAYAMFYDLSLIAQDKKTRTVRLPEN